MQKKDFLEIIKHAFERMNLKELENFYEMLDEVHTIALEEMKRR